MSSRRDLPDIRRVFGIRGFVFAESLKIQDAGKQAGILLFGQSLGMQFAQCRFSSTLRGAVLAPASIFRSHEGGGQSDSAEDDYHQRNIETHFDHPSTNLTAPSARREGHSTDCKCRSNSRGILPWTVLFSKIARAASQFPDCYQPGP